MDWNYIAGMLTALSLGLIWLGVRNKGRRRS